jgi:hypothetical protein
MSLYDWRNTADDSERDDPWRQHPEGCECPACEAWLALQIAASVYRNPLEQYEDSID